MLYATSSSLIGVISLQFLVTMWFKTYFFRLGDSLRDCPATTEVETFVPNICRHGGAMAEQRQSAKILRQIRQNLETRLIIRQLLNDY